MSAATPAAAASVVIVRLSSGRPTARPKMTGVDAAETAFEQRQGLGELPRPRPRDGIIEREREACARSGIEAPLDQLPWLEIVRERQRAEIVAERRAGPRRDREHGGDARNDGDIERPPNVRTALDRFAHRSGHGEHAGVSARDDCRVSARSRMAERRLGARALLAIVRSMPPLTGAHRNAVEIGAVAEERVGGGERLVCLARKVALVPRAKPDDCEPPAQRRPSQPGTSTMAK